MSARQDKERQQLQQQQDQEHQNLARENADEARKQQVEQQHQQQTQQLQQRHVQEQQQMNEKQQPATQIRSRNEDAVGVRLAKTEEVESLASKYRRRYENNIAHCLDFAFAGCVAHLAV
jgi:hypothetical protein